MLKTKKQKLIVILILILICVFLILTYQKDSPQLPSDITSELPPLPAHPESGLAKEGVLEGEVADLATLKIEDKIFSSEITEKISVYDFMQQLVRENKITFKDSYFIGLGKFIEEINGVRSTAKTAWIYYVNDQKAQVGISNYKIKPGDVVTWKLESNIY